MRLSKIIKIKYRFDIERKIYSNQDRQVKGRVNRYLILQMPATVPSKQREKE